VTRRALVNAVVAQLRAAIDPKVTVYDGAVPATPNKPAVPYVVVYPDTAPLSRDRLAAESTLARLRFQVTSVGVTRDHAQAVADTANAALIDHRLTVPGWAPGPIALDEALAVPVRPDQDVTPPVFYAVEQFTLTATAVPSAVPA
jgi:hypothetical protein